MSVKLLKVGVLFAMTAVLAACGGGGGDSPTGAPAPVPAPPAPAPIAANLVDSVPTPTYAINSPERFSFDLLNQERAFCGFGKLAQNAALDDTARGHADWQLANNYSSHYQVAGTPGFTGVFPADRAVLAGYGSGGSSFVITDELNDTLGSNVKPINAATTKVRGLLNAPYHGLGFIDAYRDVGVSIRNQVDAGGPSPRVMHQFNLAYLNSTGGQLLGTDDVKTYPCAGSTGVDRLLNNEVPNPVPGRNLAASPLGTSILVLVRVGNVLDITSATMTKVSNGAVITVRPATTSANDPNGPGVYLRSHQAFVSADAPLEANTAYSVTVNGTNNGSAFTRTFTFTTGS